MNARSIVLLVALTALLGAAMRANAGTVYSNTVQNEPNLLLYWSFDELDTSGRVVEHKQSNSQNNLVLSAATVTVNSHASLGSSLQLGSAGYVPGSGGARFLAADLSPTTNPTKYAIELWMQPASVAGAQQGFVVSCDGDSPAVAFDFSDAGDNSVTLYKGDGVWPLTDNPRINDTQWHYLLFVVDGANVSAYLDDSKYNLTGSFNQVLTVTGAFAVGAHTYSSYWGYAGWIDEVAFYDFTGLDSPQIAARGAALAGHYSLALVPEPATVLLLLAAAMLLPWWVWKRRQP